jgi:predicted amidohydrolase
MKVAAAQISCSLGNPDANLLKVSDFSARAKEAGAELIIFPEMVDTGYSMSVIRACAVPWTGGFVPDLQKIAEKLSIAIVSGVSERDGAFIYNSQVFVDQQGKIVEKYRKTHLFAVTPIEEDKCFSPCDTFASFALGDLRFGFSICYDLRFPEMYRKLVTEQNVGALLISSAWPFPRDEHFRVLAQARAIENQSYVIASNRVGKDDELWFCGSSAIIDPRGITIAAASPDREDLIHADLSQELVDSVRQRVHSLGHRRRTASRLVNRIEVGISLWSKVREPLRCVSRIKRCEDQAMITGRSTGPPDPRTI